MQPERLSILLDLADRPCLVVGAGPVGRRRVDALRRAGAAVRWVAPEAEAIQGVQAIRGDFLPVQLEDALLVCACTDNPQTNAAIAAQARQAGCPLVYLADDPGHSDLTFQAVRRDGPICLSVSTGGTSPTLARNLLDRIELPDRAGAFADLLGRLRRAVHDATDDPQTRRMILARLAEPDAYEAFCRQGPAGPERLCRQLLEHTEPPDARNG
jgi:siroheme synthase-like protein